MELNKNPCLNAFKKYRDQKMKQIEHEGVYKQIIKDGFANKMNLAEHKVTYQYDFYLEDKEDPMDSNWITRKYGVIHEANGICCLPGLALAISSMKYEETSLFWISHELMYGEFGMCDKIPSRADIVARIKICKLFANDGKTEIKPVLTSFEAAMRSAKKTIKKAKSYFEKGSVETAIGMYVKSIEEIEKLHFSSEREENEAKELLIKMYLNLCVCYNKNKKPQKSCLAMRQLERLQSIKYNAKALYTKARALIMLDDFKNAKKYFDQALKLEPGSKTILAALDEITMARKGKKEYMQVVKKMENVLKEELKENISNNRLASDLTN